MLRCFATGKKALGIHWIGDWVGPRSGMDNVERENSCPYWNSNTDLFVIQPIPNNYTDCNISVTLV
jgi:hypothetical protein